MSELKDLASRWGSAEPVRDLYNISYGKARIPSRSLKSGTISNEDMERWYVRWIDPATRGKLKVVEYARRFGVTRQRVLAWVKAGRLEVQHWRDPWTGFRVEIGLWIREDAPCPNPKRLPDTRIRAPRYEDFEWCHERKWFINETDPDKAWRTYQDRHHLGPYANL